MTQWHFESGGAQHGPVPEEQLAQLLANGRIQPGTLVWNPSLPNWLPLAQALPALVSALPAQPPTLPQHQAPAYGAGQYPGYAPQPAPARKGSGILKKICVGFFLACVIGVGSLYVIRYLDHQKAVKALASIAEPIGISLNDIPTEMGGLKLVRVNATSNMATGSKGILLTYRQPWEINEEFQSDGVFLTVYRHKSSTEAQNYINDSHGFMDRKPIEGTRLIDVSKPGSSQNSGLFWTRGLHSYFLLDQGVGALKLRSLAEDNLKAGR